MGHVGKTFTLFCAVNRAKDLESAMNQAASQRLGILRLRFETHINFRATPSHEFELCHIGKQ